MLDVADLTDGRVALGENLANFTGGQAHLGVARVDRHDRRAAAGGAADLGAATGNDLDIVDGRAERNLVQRQSVADDRLGFRAAGELRADQEADGRDDVALFAVRILEQREMRGAVRIVFDRLDRGHDAVLVALEIDEAVALLVAAADVTRRETAAVVASARLLEPFGELADRGVALGEFLEAIQFREPE